jgi:hypothetical protein
VYTLLTGAKINMGDFLITDRCQKLLKAHLPDEEQFVLPHWEQLDSHLERINSSKAIIIMGGPGFQPQFYPGVYKLASDLSRIKVPIVPMGLGWKGVPGDYRTLQGYRFSPVATDVLKRISLETTFLGCRDYMTAEVLRRNGISNPLMTGCPVWYHLDSLGKPFSRPSAVNSIVVTPAQRPVYRDQSVALLKEITTLLPKAKKYCSFNRGIDQEHPLLSAGEKRNNRHIADAANGLGYEVKDTSGGLENTEFYEDCDLHLGYRVHSHLHFISRRMPSILLHEDGRGRGMSEALNLLGVDAFAPSRGVFRKLKPSDTAVEQVRLYLRAEMDSGFARFAGADRVIDAHYDVMCRFIQSLPGAPAARQER